MGPFKIIKLGIPCGPVARASCFHCFGSGFSPCLGIRFHKLHGLAKNNKIKLNVCVCVSPLSHFWLFVTSWTVAHQVPLSMGFHFLLQRIVPTRFDPGIEPCSIALQRFFNRLSHQGSPKDINY